MKTLSDLCLHCVSRNFSELAGDLATHQIPGKLKERLLHQLIDHDLLTPQLRPAICYHLLGTGLTRLSLVRYLLRSRLVPQNITRTYELLVFWPFCRLRLRDLPWPSASASGSGSS